MIRSMVLMVVGAAALMGCATRENYESSLNAWIGRKSNDLAASWGPPTSTDKLSDGAMVLKYDKQRGQTVPTGQILPQTTSYVRGPFRDTGPGTTYGQSTGYVIGASPVRVIRECITTFRTDSAGTILGWTAEGNDCIA
jgi:hypothetical protein